VIHLPTEEKAKAIAELADKLGKAKLAVLTDYRGLTVVQLGELRKQLRPLKVEYEVAKNTLVRKAAETVGIAALEKPLEGPTAIAFCYDDVVAPSKVLGDFARTSKILTIKSALLGRKLITPAEVAQLATLPSREIMVGKLLGTMQMPIASLLSVLNGPARGLLQVLQARAKQLDEGPASS
jgi:large subunit ribosomal protein L10